MIKLTKREEEVVNLVAKGLSNLEISNIMNIKLMTVKVHINHARKAFNAKSRVDLALKYLEDRKLIKRATY